MDYSTVAASCMKLLSLLSSSKPFVWRSDHLPSFHGDSKEMHVLGELFLEIILGFYNAVSRLLLFM